MINLLKAIAKKIPPIGRLAQQRDQLWTELQSLKRERSKFSEEFSASVNNLSHENEQIVKQKNPLEAHPTSEALFVPPGHFYSPIPAVEEIKKHENKIFNTFTKKIPGINLNEENQLKLFEKIKKYYDELPFPVEKSDNLRYFFNNPHYSYSDAIILYSMIRFTNPKRIIEIGSGYSSCVMLDTNELFFESSIDCSFIEPYPELLHSLLKKGDLARVEIFAKKLQDIDIGYFNKLKENDILFIDSTHVCKTNSDVNYIFFEILPSLKQGVYIHIHDIFYPFEYLKEWVMEGRAWNEAYLLRAFLQYNERFEIEFFNTFLEVHFDNIFKKNMPLCLKNHGGSIWIRKVQK